MKKLLLIFLICFQLIGFLKAQTSTSGIITYEKRINVHALVDKYYTQEYYKKPFKESKPQFRTTTFKLNYNNRESLYQPEKKDDDPIFNFLQYYADENLVYKDLSDTLQYLWVKAANDYLVKAPANKIKWKLTNETKKILGHDCIRANAVVSDTVFLVAYYTEDIPFSIGPETISGLPGAILGLHIPVLHSTWYAIHIEDNKLDIKKPKVFNDISKAIPIGEYIEQAYQLNKEKYPLYQNKLDLIY